MRWPGILGLVGSAKTVSGRVDFDATLRVAGSRTGAAVMVWAARMDGDRFVLRGRRVSPRGRLGPIRTLAGDVSDGDWGLDEQLVVDAQGNATVVWNRVIGARRGGVLTEASVHLRRWDADGSLGPVVDIPTEGGFDWDPGLAVGGSGRVALVWHRRANDLSTVRASWITPGGRVEPSLAVSVPGPYWTGEPVDVAVDRFGRATFTWVASSEAGASVAVRRLSDRGLGPLQTLAGPSFGLYGPSVAVDKAGTATVAWRDAGGFGNGAMARQLGTAGRQGPLRALSAPGGDVSVPQLAADGRGRTTVVWSRVPSVAPRRLLVEARAFGRDGRLGATRELNAGQPASFVQGIEVVGDRRGVVTAAWLEGTRTAAIVRAVRFFPRSPAGAGGRDAQRARRRARARP